jgi:hypothetical protein
MAFALWGKKLRWRCGARAKRGTLLMSALVLASTPLTDLSAKGGAAHWRPSRLSGVVSSLNPILRGIDSGQRVATFIDRAVG